MPQLLLIAASGTAQRRLLEETAAELEKKGYTAAGRQEGGDWNSLLSDNMTGGLFDDKRFIIIESAPLLGQLPEKLSFMVDPSSDVALILVYESDPKSQPAKFIPKETLAKCRMLKAAEFPRWPRERQQWVSSLARELGVKVNPGGVSMIVELLDDPEEIRAQLKSLALFKRGGEVSAADVEQLCLDDGSRNLLRLLDGLCDGDAVSVLRSFRAISRSGELIPTLTPIHNRMRLAWYSGLGKDGLFFAQALGAKDYAWRKAKEADRRYGHAALTDFISALLRISIEERSGMGAGWNGLETAIAALLSAAR
ncbi:MAG: hypothetical protein Q4D58_00175 [Synergistaceae bacterium]|nr:hypothetical protein [Synergistaceae bacterium]